jgi:hypothetical protein
MPSPIDLILISDLNQWLDITTNDPVTETVLAQLITQISRAILNILDRPSILPANYTEVLNGSHGHSVLLRNWPVNSVSSCLINGVTIPASPPLSSNGRPQMGYVLDMADSSPPGRMQRLYLRHYCFAPGVQNISVSYNAGYLYSESFAIPQSGSRIAAAPYGSWGSDMGVTFENGSIGQALTSASSLNSYQYSINLSTAPDIATYQFSTDHIGEVVTINYGYVPSDLATCCLEWAAERYAYRSRIGQQSKSLGGQETVSFIVKEMPDYVARVLQPYRRVVTL